MRTPGRRASVALFLALLLVGWWLLFAHGVFGSQAFVARDLYGFHRPLKALLLRLASESHGWPEWNPYSASGQPFAANPQHALFHPLTALFFVLPFETAFGLQVALPPLAGAWAAFGWQTRRGRSRAAASLAGLAFAFGGALLSATNLLPTLFAFASLPALAWAACEAVRAGTRTSLAALAAAFGLVALAGDPATLLVAPLVAAGSAAEEVLRGRRPWSALGRTGVGLLLGAALAACVLVPGARLASRSVRAEGLDAKQAGIWSMPAERFSELAWPPSAQAARADGLYPERGEPFIYSLFPGRVVTLAALAAVGAFVLRVRRRRGALRLVPWVLLAALGALLALGDHTPVWALVRRLPLWSGVRYPERFVLLFCFVLTVFAAEGFDVLRGLPRGWGRALRRATPVVLALLVLDLVVAGRSLVRTWPRAALARVPPLVEQLRSLRVDGPIHHAAGWTALRRESYEQSVLRPPMPALWGIKTLLEPDFDLTELAWSRHATSAFRDLARRAPAVSVEVLRRRGAVALVRLRDDVRVQDGLATAPLGAAIMEPVLLSRPQAQVFLAARTIRAAGVEGWVAAALRLGPRLVDTVVLESAGPEASWPAEPGPGRAEIVVEEPGRLVLDVAVDGPVPGVLALNRTWDEYWQARVDGASVHLARVDLALQALLVPTGAHRVELRYVDRALRLGLSISALTGLGLAAWLFMGCRRGRA